VTVSVTGAAGFIGGHLVSSLREAGHRVRGFDVRPCPAVRHLDVRHPFDPSVFAGSTVVVHLAALTGVRASWSAPDAYLRTNVIGTEHVLAAARAAGVERAVVASSSSVYGHCEVPAAEGQALKPLSPYGESKARAEDCALRAAGGLEVVIVRPFSVYGPGQRADMLIARLLRGDRLVMWPFERDFTFIDEVVDGIRRAALVPLPGPVSVVNLGSGRPVGARSLTTLLADGGQQVHARFVTKGPRGEPQRTWADVARAREWLGQPPPRSFASGLHEQVSAFARSAGAQRQLAVTAPG